MPIAEIASRKVTIGKQSALGTLALVGAGVALNFRPATTMGLSKESFTSDSIRTDQQRSNPRHGLRRGQATIEQELQVAGHKDLMAAALRGSWAASITTTALTTIGINSATRTISRASGSFVTDGFCVGDIVRASGFVAGANNGKNYRLATVSALSMTYHADTWLTGITTESAGASVTISVPGKKLQIPSASHTKDYFTIDDWHPDVSNQTTIKDAVVNTMAMDIAPGAHAQVTFGLLGTDATPTGTSQYFTTIAAAPTGALLAGPNGLLRYNGADSAVVQQLQINLDGGADVRAVIGSNKSPDVFRESVTVTGSMSALFDNASGGALANFDAETEAPLYLYLFADSTAGSDFVIIKLPSVKVMGADKTADGPAMQLSGDLSMGKLSSGTALETTTLVIVDSQVS